MAFSNRWVRLGLTAAVCTCVLVSCEDAPPTPASSSIPINESIGEVVAATINGQPIYVSDVQLEAEARELVASGDPLPADSAAFTQVLNSLIDDRLLAREARAQGLDRDPFVKHRVDVITNRLLGDALLSRAVDEQHIQKQYETMINLKMLELGEEYRIRDIVLPTREAADALLKELSPDTDFAVLASNRSIDERTRLEGGDLGWLNPERIPEAYADAILNTPIGGVSAPFETQFGWHVIKVEEKREEPPPKLEYLRPLIHQRLVEAELAEVLKRLHKEATIIRNFEQIEGPIMEAPVGDVFVDEEPAQDAVADPSTENAEADEPVSETE